MGRKDNEKNLEKRVPGRRNTHSISAEVKKRLIFELEKHHFIEAGSSEGGMRGVE